MLEQITIKDLKDYKISSKLTTGENSIIYTVKNSKNTEKILKLNIYNSPNPFQNSIMFESEILQIMSKTEGFPKLLKSGKSKNISYSIITKFGPSLENLKQICENKFSLKTTLLIFDQMLLRIEAFHKKGLVHCYLTPDHFLIGTKKKSDTIFLISFEKTRIASSGWRSENLREEVDFFFMSVNQLEGGVVSWKDDLESLCYIVVYFLNGLLPWSRKVVEVFEEEERGVVHADHGFKGNHGFGNDSGSGENGEVFTNEDNGNLENIEGNGEIFANEKNGKVENIDENEKACQNEHSDKVGKNKVIIKDETNEKKKNLLADIKFEILKMKKSITLEELTKGLPGNLKRRNFGNFEIL